MKAFVLGQDGPAISEIAAPKPGPEDILVRVRACALNRADLGMARGHMHGGAGGAGAVLGLEWAGEIVETGAGVTGFKAGDRVMGSGSGAFAEYTVADFGRVASIPDSNLSYERAAALPVALQTMHDAIVTNGALQRGQAVLIQGASSGVGLMGMRIAKFMGAQLVIGSSTDDARRARLSEFGADLAIDSRDPDWPKAVLDATGGAGVDLIVDQISSGQVNQNLRATKILGRIVNVGRLGGTKGEFDFDLHALRRISYIGVTFRTRTKAEVREINKRMRADLWAGVQSGALSLPIDKIFAFEDLPEAFAHMAANKHLGKIAVSVG